MGAMQRRKGARFEVATARAFAVVFPGARRGIGQARSAGEVADVEGTPFWPECKRGAGSTPDAALAQASAASDGRVPVAVVRRDKKRATATMYLEDFLALLAAARVDSARDLYIPDETRMRIREAVALAESDGRTVKKPPKDAA